MESQKLYSTGEAAAILDITRDALIAALRSGAPEPSRTGGRRVFGPADLERLREWFAARGRQLGQESGS